MAIADKNTVRNEVAQLKAIFCNVCGEDLRAVTCSHHERRTKIDIVFEKVVKHVDAEVKSGPNCQSTTKGGSQAICKALFNTAMG